MSNSSSSTPNYDNSDDAHEDLMATLAAARELNPEMDKALADQYLARREQQKKSQTAPAVVPQEQRNMTTGWRGFSVLPSFGAVFLIVLLVVSVVQSNPGFFWSLFWIPLVFGGWGWWGWGHHGGRNDYRYQRYQARDRYRQARWEARHGHLPPEDSYDDPAQQVQAPRRPPVENF